MVVDSRNMLLLKEYEPAFEYLMTGLIKLDKTNDAIDELRRGLELFPENTILLDLKKQLDDFEANNLLDNITATKQKQLLNTSPQLNKAPTTTKQEPKLLSKSPTTFQTETYTKNMTTTIPNPHHHPRVPRSCPCACVVPFGLPVCVWFFFLWGGGGLFDVM